MSTFFQEQVDWGTWLPWSLQNNQFLIVYAAQLHTFTLYRQLEFYCINSHSADCRKEHWRWKFRKLSANFIIFRKRGENDNYYLIQKHSKKIFLPFKSCHSLLNVYNVFQCFQIIQMPSFTNNVFFFKLKKNTLKCFWEHEAYQFSGCQ